MKKKKAFESLPIWTESIALVKDIYLLTSIFPEEEDDLISKKLHKQSIEIPSNIAKAMLNQEDRIDYLKAANYNIIEIQTLIVISENLGFIEAKDVEKIKDKTDLIESNLQGLVHKLSKS